MSVAAIAGGLHCDDCDLIFKDPSVFLNQKDQKARYDTHNNDSNDEGYLNSLRVLWTPLKEILNRKGLKKGLDFGSGPNPVLAELMRNDGFEVDIYDPFYAPNNLLGKYDFITSTEVIEHFENPFKEFARIASLLRPNGIFAGLTRFHPGTEKFNQWWYQRDPTHVCFFSEKTFQNIGEKFKFKKIQIDSPIFILQAESETQSGL
jgi:hypothetical protein